MCPSPSPRKSVKKTNYCDGVEKKKDFINLGLVEGGKIFSPQVVTIWNVTFGTSPSLTLSRTCPTHSMFKSKQTRKAFGSLSLTRALSKALSLQSQAWLLITLSAPMKFARARPLWERASGLLSLRCSLTPIHWSQVSKLTAGRTTTVKVRIANSR